MVLLAFLLYFTMMIFMLIMSFFYVAVLILECVVFKIPAMDQIYRYNKFLMIYVAGATQWLAKIFKGGIREEDEEE